MEIEQPDLNPSASGEDGGRAEQPYSGQGAGSSMLMDQMHGAGGGAPLSKLYMQGWGLALITLHCKGLGEAGIGHMELPLLCAMKFSNSWGSPMGQISRLHKLEVEHLFSRVLLYLQVSHPVSSVEQKQHGPVHIHTQF